MLESRPLEHVEAGDDSLQPFGRLTMLSIRQRVAESLEQRFAIDPFAHQERFGAGERSIENGRKILMEEPAQLGHRSPESIELPGIHRRE